MQAFPGFDDQAAFPTKLDETLDQLVSQRDRGRADYTDRHRALVRRPDRRLRMGAPPTSADDRVLPAPSPLISVNDARQGHSLGRPARRRGRRHHRDRDLQRHHDHRRHAARRGVRDRPKDYGGYAIVGPRPRRWATSPRSRRRIDTNGKTGLATDEQFAAASATLPGDHLVFGYSTTPRLRDATSRTWRRARASGCPELPGVLDAAGPPRGPPSRSAPRTARSSSSRARRTSRPPAPAKNAESKLPSLLPPTPSSSPRATTSASRSGGSATCSQPSRSSPRASSRSTTPSP